MTFQLRFIPEIEHDVIAGSVWYESKAKDLGEERTMFFPIGGNVFCGPEGMLNVVVCNYMDDGSFVSDPDYLDFAPVTAVDRYDWAGSYLDSYCLPDSSLNYVAGLPDGRVVARNFAEGIICQMELVQGR
ncbi:MAG: hypothetical protein KAH31_03015 [Candidatus Sabulitectum sp.]|nr:hypothetical protein [Candidatus Sabulitectum sp.]